MAFASPRSYEAPVYLGSVSSPYAMKQPLFTYNAVHLRDHRGRRNFDSIWNFPDYLDFPKAFIQTLARWHISLCLFAQQAQNGPYNWGGAWSIIPAPEGMVSVGTLDTTTSALVFDMVSDHPSRVGRLISTGFWQCEASPRSSLSLSGTVPCRSLTSCRVVWVKLLQVSLHQQVRAIMSQGSPL